MVEITRDTDEVLNYAIIRLIVSWMTSSLIGYIWLIENKSGCLERTVHGFISPRHGLYGASSYNGNFPCCNVSRRQSAIRWAAAKSPPGS